jgi:hypothetical protein
VELLPHLSPSPYELEFGFGSPTGVTLPTTDVEHAIDDLDTNHVLDDVGSL